MICYICLEPTRERSPCQCRAPAHRSCLRVWRRDHRVCGICRCVYRDIQYFYGAVAAGALLWWLLRTR